MDLEAIYGIPRVTVQGTDFYITKGQPARPFLYPSLVDLIGEAPEIYKEHLQRKLRELK